MCGAGMSCTQSLEKRVACSRTGQQDACFGENGKRFIDPLHKLRCAYGAVGVRRCCIRGEAKSALANTIKTVYVAHGRSRDSLGLQGGIRRASGRGWDKQADWFVPMASFFHRDALHVA